MYNRADDAIYSSGSYVLYSTPSPNVTPSSYLRVPAPVSSVTPASFGVHGRQMHYQETLTERRQRLAFSKQREWMNASTSPSTGTETYYASSSSLRSHHEISPSSSPRFMPSPLYSFPIQEVEESEPLIFYSTSPLSSPGASPTSATFPGGISSSPAPSISPRSPPLPSSSTIYSTPTKYEGRLSPRSVPRLAPIGSRGNRGYSHDF